ncbi:hypothetical protein ACFL6Y_10435 [Elusimicrobiota bacterium]
MKNFQANYYLDPKANAFIVENYNWASAFSNFLPGIAGKWGIPLWTFYVSRAQAMISAGVQDKNHQILEFQSFNKAVSRIAREGFRTFARVNGKDVYEPFQRTKQSGIMQTMIVSSHELVIRETNNPLNLEFEVAYFTIPNMPFAGLARTVSIFNMSTKTCNVEVIDGAARFIPYGINQAQLKSISRHIEAMMGVEDDHGAALFRLKQTSDDSSAVGKIIGGNFYASAGVSIGNGIIVDPEVIFGEAFNYDYPWIFAQDGLNAVLSGKQYFENKTPCAFTAVKKQIPGGSRTTLESISGYVGEDNDLKTVQRELNKKDFIRDKRSENKRMIDRICDHSFTASASSQLDAYARQNYLDNVMRGGVPVPHKTKHGLSSSYLYSRRHGDLERDYHHFVLEASYLSQGNAFFRDATQNRRTDVWFFPEIEDSNIKSIMNLIQLDGYNPLEIKGVTYRSDDDKQLNSWLKRNIKSSLKRKEYFKYMKTCFAPGELIMRLERDSLLRGKDRDRIISEALGFSRENEIGDLHEGFWTDHWHYTIDLLESYFTMYPEHMRTALIGKRVYRFFDDPDIILPRSEKTVCVDNKVRCYGAVVRDKTKLKRISSRKTDKYSVRTRYGDGKIYTTHLLVKLLVIIINRLATIDPAGIGIEMEAGKPGWNDSMNGLPGLFGSGLSETIELKRALRFLLDALDKMGFTNSDQIDILEEFSVFMHDLHPLMRNRLKSKSKKAAFDYWDKANALKEAYRAKTKHGVSGKERKMFIHEIYGFLSDGKFLIDSIFATKNRNKLLSKDGVPYTYFVNEVDKYHAIGRRSHQGHSLVRATSFKQRPVKLFLEGAVHWLKDMPEQAQNIYRAVKRSDIYDRKLKMYKVCENMAGESYELGRAVGAYPRGWIENESVYLHMQYKWMLEVLRSGLCDEFWDDAKTALVPFVNPTMYGRSILEGASFIVSSAFADPRYHGRAYQPRLSGLTCEFIQMWTTATAGSRPFKLDEIGFLEFSLEPRLPGWLFTNEPVSRTYFDMVDGWTQIEIPKDAFAFKLMSRTLVVYHNPMRKPTYGQDGVSPVKYSFMHRNGSASEAMGTSVSTPYSTAIRNGDIKRIDIELR